MIARRCRPNPRAGATPWYLRLLSDEGVTAQRMARVLASSRYAADLLLRAPEAVAMERERRGRSECRGESRDDRSHQQAVAERRQDRRVGGRALLPDLIE